MESERDEDDGDEKALRNKAAGDEATMFGEFTNFAGMSIQRWQDGGMEERRTKGAHGRNYPAFPHILTLKAMVGHVIRHIKSAALTLSPIMVR